MDGWFFTSTKAMKAVDEDSDFYTPRADFDVSSVSFRMIFGMSWT